jgi:hypothetical protein
MNINDELQIAASRKSSANSRHPVESAWVVEVELA